MLTRDEATTIRECLGATLHQSGLETVQYAAVAVRPGLPRVAQLRAGREAAGIALGQPDIELPSLSTGAVEWPPGWSGSISHVSRYAIAACVRQGKASLGVDLERVDTVDWQDIAPSFTITSERELGLSSPFGLARIFSGKEAAWKALPSKARRSHSFPDLLVETMYSLGDPVKVAKRGESNITQLFVRHPDGYLANAWSKIVNERYVVSVATATRSAEEDLNNSRTKGCQ